MSRRLLTASAARKVECPTGMSAAVAAPALDPLPGIALALAAAEHLGYSCAAGGYFRVLSDDEGSRIPCCCPMGAVALCSGVIPPEVSFTVAHASATVSAVADALGVDSEWVCSFAHGFDDEVFGRADASDEQESRDGYWSGRLVALALRRRRQVLS